MILMTVMASDRWMISYVVQKEQFQNIFMVVFFVFLLFFYLLLFQFSEIQSLSNNDGNWKLFMKTEDDSISFSLSLSLEYVSSLCLLML